MPSTAWTPVANLTLSTNQTSVTFSNINQEHKDLTLIIDGSFASAGSYYVRLNSDSGTNYSRVIAQAQYNNSTYSTASTGANSLAPWDPNNYDANTRFMSTTNFMDYSTNNKYKNMLFKTSGYQISSFILTMAAGLWANTSAVTSISIIGTQDFNAGSTFALYGVSA
jgi:hypothetical protein